MIRVTCENYQASVEAKGQTSKLFIESLGLIFEGFKLIRKLDDTLYETTKEDIFMAILNGKLDEATTSSDDSDCTEIHVDMNEILKQMKEEEGEN